jgi:hypothetical protein
MIAQCQPPLPLPWLPAPPSSLPRHHGWQQPTPARRWHATPNTYFLHRSGPTHLDPVPRHTGSTGAGTTRRINPQQGGQVWERDGRKKARRKFVVGLFLGVAAHRMVVTAAGARQTRSNLFGWWLSPLPSG